MKSSQNNGTATRILKVFLVAVLVVSLLLFFISRWEKKNGFDKIGGMSEPEKTISVDGKTYVLNNDIETLLVLGLDTFEYKPDDGAFTNDSQADFLLLLVADKGNKTVSALHINRDTVVDINLLGVAGQKVGTMRGQIALSHNYGSGDLVSCRNTAESVSGYLHDIRINNYMSVTMDAVGIVNDLVGGVEVEVLHDFSGSELSEKFVKGEKVNLKGDDALSYVRSRKDVADSTNMKRMERQKQYLEALYIKLIDKADDESFIADVGLKIGDYVVSSSTISEMESFFGKIKDYAFKGIVEIEGTTEVVDDYMEFTPDEDALQRVIADLFYKEK